MADDSGERSEQATEKRMREVHSKGQLSRSQDLSAWVGVGATAVMIPSTIERAAEAGTDQLFTIKSVIAHPDDLNVVNAMMHAFGSMASTLGPMLAVVGIAVLATAVAQGGVHLKRMTGSYQQFNLLTGVKRLFGTQALWQGAKSLIKTAVVGLVLWFAVQGLMPVLMSGGGLSVSALIEEAQAGTGTLLRAAIAAGLLLGAADVFVVIRRNRKKTRMTKKEIKDEHKSSDGDPLVKSQRRSRQLSMSRNRMIGAIADSNVVLVNPTSYAVALTYEPGKSAPRVVAKGAGVMAARIREQAETSSVPIVTDVPLTRALHAACGLGDEIPVDLYTPVARVLTFVMTLQARGAAAAAGQHVNPRPTTADEVATVLTPDSLDPDVVPRRLRIPSGAAGPAEARAAAGATPSATAARPSVRPRTSGAH
ncbi:EscU/YscU/HrcU family type III secretion system export apparatus switch protein [Frigoribacterium sp. 2-23]|uniref:EscU/YscU/HrcU family type III secretion system export apparatus switch protein n=1 Tax=Frigoribacterium sp. 2-23 TaxID=3415006 RepID=UPI003C6EBE4F